MSRIILSRWPEGSARLVVGWDHPAGGAFWQEFNKDLEAEPEVIREGGFWPGLPLDKLQEDMPDDLRPLVTDKVMKLLQEHAEDPDSGYRHTPIDLSYDD